MIDKINQGTQKNGKGFAAARRRIYQAAFSIDNVLPGLLLEYKWLKTIPGEPVYNNSIPFCISQHSANLPVKVKC